MSEPIAVHIDSAALTDIGAHARAELPQECCGLLIGAGANDARVMRVERAMPARNVAEEPTRRYLVDPGDHFRLLRELRASRGAGIVGVYHSHPVSRPAPSPTDLAEALPNFLYVIVSPRAASEASETRAWWLVDGNFLEIPLVISS